AGKNINVTLIFSLHRYEEVVEAYVRGLERVVASGKDPSKVASVASFFVSRVDTEADRRLEEIGTDKALALRGKLAIANAKLAYQHYLEVFSGERWDFLAAKGAARQRPLWASTSTKNPEYRDVMYVEELIGPDTVDTMPPATIEAFREHGVVDRTVDKKVAAAEGLLREIEAVGISMKDVTAKLLGDGIASFQKSFDELIGGLESKIGSLAPGGK